MENYLRLEEAMAIKLLSKPKVPELPMGSHA